MKMKKLLISFMAILLMATTMLGTIGNAAYESKHPQLEAEANVTRAEQTQWYHRYYQGRPEKRLWSITRGIWLTNWIPL